MKLIDLALIDPNPWQPRQHMDPAGIEELAADIAARQNSRPDTWGLLQVPAGRWVDENGQPAEFAHGQRVQLAYGHRRHAAFALLAAKVKDWPQAMPLEIVTFSDEEMASAAWSENMARKDLTAIEEAEFIVRFLEDFKLSHKEAAERLAMARSTLSNRLRLLKLPEDIRDHVRTGAMPERTALALLPLYDLPAEWVANYEATAAGWQTKPSEIIAEALDGADSDSVREDVAMLYRYATVRIETPLDHAFEGLPDIVQPACTGCPNLRQHNNEARCLMMSCVALKEAAWPDIALARASEATGVRIDDANESVPLRELGGWWDLEDEAAEELEAQVLGMSCEHRRLVFEGDATALDAEKYPGVGLNCAHGECPCVLAVTDAYLAEHPEDLEAREKEAAEEKERRQRQEQHQKEWEQRRKEREEAEKRLRQELQEPVKAQLTKLLAAGDLATLRLLTLEHYALGSRSVAVIEEDTNRLKNLNAVWQALAGKIVSNVMTWEARNEGMAAARAQFQKLIDLGVAIELPAEEEKPAKKKRSKEVVNG